MFSNHESNRSFLTHSGTANSQTHYHGQAHSRRLHEHSLPNRDSSAVSSLISANLSTYTSLKRERFIAMGSL